MTELNLLIVLLLIVSVVFIVFELFLVSYYRKKYLIKKYSYFNEENYPHYICQNDEKLTVLNLLQIFSQNYLSFSTYELLIFRNTMMQYLFNSNFVVENVYPTMKRIYEIKYQKTLLFNEVLTPTHLIDLVSEQDKGQYNKYYYSLIKVKLFAISIIVFSITAVTLFLNENTQLLLINLVLTCNLIYLFISTLILKKRQLAFKDKQVSLNTSVDKLSESILLVYRTLIKETDKDFQLDRQDKFIGLLKYLMENKEVEVKRNNVIPILKLVADNLTLYSLKQIEKNSVYDEINSFNEKITYLYDIKQ